MTQLKTPVGFIIYHRPEKTKKVFEAIRRAKPKQLFVFADGPKDKIDQKKCEQARDVIEKIDWHCKVYKNYSSKNLGCKIGEYTAFNWIFNQVEEAIILEDDTLPDQTFFWFCQELLEKYRNDTRIFQIAGVNFQQKNTKFKCDDSYYFSAITQTWGWASWRRAWKFYDLNMNLWPEIKRQGLLNNILNNKAAIDYWEYLMEKTYQNADSWDAQWVLACWLQHGLSINPKTNLITNIGYGEGAAHKTEYMKISGQTDDLINLPRQSLKFPLKHPQLFIINREADEYTLKYVYRINKTFRKKLRWFFKSNLPIFYNLLKILYYKYKDKLKEKNNY